MRWLSSLASRVSPALRTQTKPRKPLLPSSPHKGNSFPSNLISAKNPKFPVIDHLYIARVLSRKDWFLLLDHELNARRILLTPQSVASVLQNQQNPLHPLKFSIWFSNVDPLFLKNQSVRGVLANTLFRKGPVVLSVEFLKDVKNSGLKVTEDLLCILIGSWGRLGLAKYCAAVFGQISFLGLTLSTRLYNAVIDALVKSNSLDLAYLKFQQMPADNCHPDRFTYNILIHGVCKIGIVDEAVRLVKQMEGLGYLPNVHTYTNLVDGFCKSKRVDEAFRVIKIMRYKNVTPNAATVRSLVHGVFRCMDPGKAFELLLSFVERESLLFKVACDTILYCLSNNHMSREIALFLKKFGAKGYLPDSSTFNITMVCLTKELAHAQDEVHELFENYIQGGGKPGFGTYLVLIEAMYKSGNIDEGNQIFEQLIKDGLLSSVHSYNMVINCFCKAQILDRASRAFGDMQHNGILPNLVTFNTLLAGYCKAGEISKAHELLIMLLEHGFKPDIFTFSTIIDGLCRVNQIDDAFDCFFEMVSWGITPNVITYNILLRSLCFIGDIARAERLMENMQVDGIKPDSYSFSHLIQSFCRMNKVEKAEEHFLVMLKSGLNPDNYTYSVFIKALCDLGKLDVAKEIFLSMEAYDYLPNSSLCSIMLDSLIQHNRFEEACRMVKSFVRRKN
ncbi:hypothetical protein ACLB2K_053042 [Fragaria x ananassa]